MFVPVWVDQCETTEFVFVLIDIEIFSFSDYFFVLVFNLCFNLFLLFIHRSDLVLFVLVFKI